MLCTFCPPTILGDLYRIPEKSPKSSADKMNRACERNQKKDQTLREIRSLHFQMPAKMQVLGPRPDWEKYCKHTDLGLIRHRHPGPHPRIRLAFLSSGSIWHRFNIDSTSIRHRFPDLRPYFDAKSTPEEGKARRVRGWGAGGGLCLINPSQVNTVILGVESAILEKCAFCWLRSLQARGGSVFFWCQFCFWNCCFASSPEKFRDHFFRICLGVWHWKMAGIFGEFLWSPLPGKQSQKILEKFGENSEETPEENPGWKIRGTFIMQLFWPKELL